VRNGGYRWPDVAHIEKGSGYDHMTEIDDAVISEALAIIDKGLGDMLHRELVSTDEVADLLLDVRSLLVHPDTDALPTDEVAVGS
jgi:hypothetical protein